MKDEFSDRHQAIKLRLAGHSVEYICQTLGRSREWFHTWWRRYQAMGVAGLYDLTRANHRPRASRRTWNARSSASDDDSNRNSILRHATVSSGPARSWPNSRLCMCGHCHASAPSNASWSATG